MNIDIYQKPQTLHRIPTNLLHPPTIIPWNTNKIGLSAKEFISPLNVPMNSPYLKDHRKAKGAPL